MWRGWFKNLQIVHPFRGVNRRGWLVHIYYTVRDTVYCFHQGYEKLKEGRKKKMAKEGEM